MVFGASTNPSRYSFLAINKLLDYGHEVVPFGIKKGELRGLDIINEMKVIEDVDTITLYLGPQNQPQYYDYILSLQPKRVIFNPGTHNQELIDQLNEKGIETEDACTLVMLSTGEY